MFKNKNKTRVEQEQKEGYNTQNVNVPEARFQTEQQQVPATAALKTTVDDKGFGKQKVNSAGSVLKQEVAAHVVAKGVGGGDVPGDGGISTMSLSYGGNEGVILDSAAYTPSAGKSRSDSRMGKKLDSIAKKINFVPSEQVEEEFSESKPLADAGDRVQGYNGTVRNTNARSQKNVGASPAELLFQRSLDEIKRDQAYFTTGQVVKDNDVIYGDTPTIVPEPNETTGVYTYGDTANYNLERGNFLHRNMKIKFDATGKLTQMTFEVIDASTKVNNDTIANDSSANELIDNNYAEMDRQIMDDKAGDEKADVWTPLARAVKQPTKTVGYLRDLENITGSEVFTAYKKTALGLSYQLNKAAKDGIKLVTPMAEAALGLVYPEDDSKRLSSKTTKDIFSTAEYIKGASSLFIAINDSVGKYSTKADLLTQPRSYKLAMQIADNNMNPLRVKSDFVKIVNAKEVFSTIDREYDPLQPVCISDRTALIHCYNFNDLYSFTSLDENGNPVFYKDPFVYMYNDLRNNYVVTAALPLLKGLHQYLNNVGPKIVSLGADMINTEITIPMIHSTCFMSLWSLFILSATPFIVRERVNSMRDVLYYEKNIEYPFHQLITIKEANPMNAINYSNPSYESPIEPKRMNPAAAQTWIFPEVFWPIDEQAADDTYTCVLPYYFNQEEYDTNGGQILTRKDGAYAMSYPSVRSGVRFGYLDDIYGMEERDVRLCIDRLTDIPGQAAKADGNAGVYTYSQNADGIPYATFKGSTMNIQKILALPRELGWSLTLPAGVISLIRVAAGDNFRVLTTTEPCFAQTSYKAKYWHGRTKNGAPVSGILATVSINVDRATAYKQDWDAIDATNKYSTTDEADWGFYLSIRDALNSDGTGIDGKSTFIPFTNGTSAAAGNNVVTDAKMKVFGLHKAIWTRIQKLCMALSPWDSRLYRTAGEDGIKIDPYDFLIYFGLAGFKASDYAEDVYNRSNAVLNQGFTYLKDLFTEASPLFREAGTYTESNNRNSLIK